MEDFWTTEIIPSTYSNYTDCELTSYERDCILLIDKETADNKLKDEISKSLKKIRFNNWCTGPPQNKKKNKNKKSNKALVFEHLLNINKISNGSKRANNSTYHSLQRYYSLKARLQNENCIKLYRRERFALNNPILLRQERTINNNLNDIFIKLEHKNDYSETNEEYILSQQKRYNELTRNDPHNIILWCDFAKFYDEITHLNRDNLYNKNMKEKRLNLIKQISIYEKALEYNPNSTILLLNKLNLYQFKNINNNKDNNINFLWQDIIEKNPHNTTLWKSYLYFQLTQNKNTLFDNEMNTIFLDAIRSLKKAKNKAYSSMKFNDGPDSDTLRLHIGSIEKTLLSVFITYCKYEWFCGYKAKSIALLQAMIELNIFKPMKNENICNNFERNLIYFQLFWESDCCRIGENACIGFNKFVELLRKSKTNDNEGGFLLTLFDQRKNICHKFGDFLAKTSEDNDCDGIVLYDICGFLFEINDIELQYELVVNTLDIIGIDKQLIGKSKEILSNEIFNDNNALNIELWEQFMDNGNDNCNKYMLEFGLNILESIHIHFQTQNQNESNIKMDYVPLLCSMILITNKLKGISECKQLCKSLLQNDQFNLRLYNIYAQINKQNNQFKKVYKNALKMLNLVPMEQKCYAPMLFFEYLMIEILYKNNNNVLQIIELVINAVQFKFNVISKKNKHQKEYDMNAANVKYNTLLSQKDETFWKSPNETLMDIPCSLFNSRAPSTYFFIFGFILKLLTTNNMQHSINYVLHQLIFKKNDKYLGNKFKNKSEIEFILYYILKIIEWYKNIKNINNNNDNEYIMDLIKHSCSLYPTNSYFLSCIEIYSFNNFTIRSIYKSLLIPNNKNNKNKKTNQLIVAIKYILFEIQNDLSFSCLISIFNDCLLINDCKYNVAFWRLYLYYLKCNNKNTKSITHVYTNNNDNNLSRYQKQRLKRQKQLLLNEKEKDIDRLKNIFEIAIQTISNSKMLYLSCLHIIHSYCDKDELTNYFKFFQTKYLNISQHELQT